MLVGIGARKLGGDLGAKQRRAGDAEILTDHRHIEAREVKELRHRLIAEQRLEVGRVVVDLALRIRRKMDDMGVAVAGRKLDHAQPVTVRPEAERLGIDRHKTAQRDAGRQIGFVQVIGHNPYPQAVQGTAPILPQPPMGRHAEGNWCPGEDSNFHDLAVTST